MVSTPGSRIDFVFLADRAEVMGGKLYVMGGGWDQIQIGGFPALYPMSIAGRVILPEGDPLIEHVLEFRIEGPGEPRFALGGIRFTRQGPAPTENQQAVVAAHSAATLPEAGTYTVIATLDGDASTEYRTQFEAVATST